MYVARSCRGHSLLSELSCTSFIDGMPVPWVHTHVPTRMNEKYFPQQLPPPLLYLFMETRSCGRPRATLTATRQIDSRPTADSRSNDSSEQPFVAWSDDGPWINQRVNCFEPSADASCCNPRSGGPATIMRSILDPPQHSAYRTHLGR